MNDQQHFMRLERMYLSAPYNQQLYHNNTIKISREQAIITTEVMEKHFHGAGAMHGSVYFKLLDDAAFFAVNSIIKDYMVYTVSYSVNLLRPVGAGIIKSVGMVKYQARNRFVADANLYDQEGKLAACGTGNFMRSPLKLGEMPEYTRELSDEPLKLHVKAAAKR